MGGRNSSSAGPTRLDGVVVQSSVSGRPIPRGWGTFRVSANLLWYGGFQSQSQTQSAGGKGGGGQVTSYTYSASIIMGICAGEGRVLGVRSIYKDQSVFVDGAQTALQQAGLSLNTGAFGQATWSYLTTNFPSQAIGYSGIAIAYASNYPLNSSATLPNHSFEVYTSDRVSGLDDANPSTILSSFIPSIPFWAASLLDSTSLTDYGNYCLAAGLLLSPLLDSARAASDFITEILTASNSDVVWSEGVLKFIPYGDTQVTGNGVTWTPNLTPVYDFTESDFVPAAEGDPPVLVNIKRQADSYNYVQVEFLDRSNQYNSQTVPGTDQASIDQWGKRPNPSPSSLHSICDPGVAAVVAQLLVQRTSQVRKTFTWRTADNYGLVDPMDLVTLTWADLNRVLVRITETNEVVGADGEDQIEFQAEEMLVGSAHAAALTRASSTGYAANYQAAPGSVTDFALINANRNLTGGDYELWIGANGDNANWGGCHVWVSVGGGEYLQVGSIYNKARMGVLSTALASGSDPDNVNTFNVDVSTTEAQLLTGVQADQDNATILCIVDNELIAYRDATLVSTGVYTLAHLRRGLYHSTIGAHAIGGTFVRLDDAMFRWTYAAAQVGATLSVKLQSFNLFGNAAEDLSTVTAHNVVLNPGAAPVIDLTASGISGPGTTVYTWTDLVNFLAPVGQNAVVNSEFLTGGDPPTGWVAGTNNTGLTLTSSIVSTNSFRAAKGAITGTPASGKQFDAYTQDIAKPANFLTPVLPNDWVALAARVAYQNCTGVNLYAIFYDGSGAQVSAVSNGATGGANVNGDTVDPATYGLMTMVTQAPASAKWCQIVARALCNGAASPKLWVMQPEVVRLPTNATASTAVPPYTPGPSLRDATPNVITRSSSAPSGPNPGDIWVQLDSNGRTTGTATWNGSSWLTVATSNNITRSATAPSTPTVGDIWVQLDANSRVTGFATWNGSAWVVSGTTNIITTSATAPSTPTTGDIWVQLDSNGRITGSATWNGSAWLTASTSNNITRSTTAPSTPTTGDIWVVLDTNSRVTGFQTWNGSAWVSTSTVNNVTRSITAPSSPVAGDVWVQLDSNSRVTGVATWNGTSWVQTATNNNVTQSSTAPSTPTVNDVWIQLSGTTPIGVYVWSGTAWVLAGTQPNQNLLFNSTGQINDLTGWTNDATSHFVPAFDSQKGWGFLWSFGAASTFNAMHFFSDPVGSAIGSGVTFTIQAICDFVARSSGSIDLTLACYNSSDTFLGNASGSIAMTGGFVSGQFTTIASTDHVRVFFTMDNLVTSSSSSSAFIYKIMLEKGSQASPWNDAATNLPALIDPSSTKRVKATGSIPPSVPAQSFTYSSTTSSITISWSTITMYRSDGTTVTISSGSLAISSLSAGTTYKVYPYATDTGGSGPLTLGWATGGNGVGSPADAYPSADAFGASQMYLQNRIPLNGFSVATTSSGTGGGGGGGLGCLHPDQLVGNRRAAELAVGDVVKSPAGHTRIRHLTRKACSEWFAVQVDGGGEPVVVTAEHRFLLAAGGEVRAKDLRLGQLLATSGDHAEVTGLWLLKDLADLVCIELEAPHLYFVGPRELLCHNPKP
jgi:uncharacterized protein YuzE